MNENIKNEIIRVRPETLYSTSQKVLTVNEQRILTFAILKIQTNYNSVSFTLSELEQVFNMKFGSWNNIKGYISNLRSFGIDIINEDTGQIYLVNAFSTLMYEKGKGLFTFKFNDEFLPTLHRQKRYLQYGMRGVGSFKSQYSLYLYHWLKDHMFGDISIKKDIGIHEFKEIFHVPSTKYKGRNNNFKARVWGPAVEEINEYTGYSIRIAIRGRGESTLFTIVREEDELLSKNISKDNFQCKLGKDIIDFGCADCMKINRCPFAVNISPAVLPSGATPDNLTLFDIQTVIKETLWINKYYNVAKRVRNGVASDIERQYYDHVLEKRKVNELLCSNKQLDELMDEDKEIITRQLDLIVESYFDD